MNQQKGLRAEVLKKLWRIEAVMIAGGSITAALLPAPAKPALDAGLVAQSTAYIATAVMFGLMPILAAIRVNGLRQAARGPQQIRRKA